MAAILEKPQTAGSVPTFLRRARFHVQGLADPVERAATVPTLSASGEGSRILGALTCGNEDHRERRPLKGSRLAYFIDPSCEFDVLCWVRVIPGFRVTTSLLAMILSAMEFSRSEGALAR